MSEDGETASRGHPSAQLALRPDVGNITFRGMQGTVPLPTAVGLAGLAGFDNVGLALVSSRSRVLVLEVRWTDLSRMSRVYEGAF